MKTAPTDVAGFQEILERKQAELTRVWRKGADIGIEKSADQMDEIQCASGRDLAIGHVDRQSTLLRQVKPHWGGFKTAALEICIDCDSEISPKRLAAVPWAPRCIKCQDTADRNGRERADVSELLVNAAQSACETGPQPSKCRVSRQLLAAQMWDCHARLNTSRF
jgi:DnaK suppressor protein